MAVGSAYLFPPLSSGGVSIAEPLLRFHAPLIEAHKRRGISTAPDLRFPDRRVDLNIAAVEVACTLGHESVP